MADNQQQDRTEQATPKRRQDARKKGDVPRSRELTMTGVMLSGATALLLLAGPMASQIVTGFTDALSIDRSSAFDTSYVVEALADAVAAASRGLAPFVAILIAATFISAMLLGGWSFSLKAAAPKLERLSPVRGVKRIFSAASLNELLKAMAKFGLVAAVAILWLWWSADELLALGRQAVGPAIRDALRICGVSLIVVSCALIVIALADVPFQLWNYNKKLKMTRQEVKDEFKDTEGRPEVKSRIRTLQQQIATRRMMQDVPTADVVVTNPTQYAVALKYDDALMDAPQVVAKGRHLIAERIREIAAEHDIPLFSAPPLARALYRSTKIGQQIPVGLYTAVAQVLAYILQIKDAGVTGQALPEPPIPEVDESQYQ